MRTHLAISSAVVALMLTTSLGAQQRLVVLGQEDSAVAARKQLLQTFEGVIERAIISGGNRLADRARTVVPDIELWLEGSPQVSAVPVPDVGVFVDVQIPDVNAASLRLFSLMRENNPLRPRPASGGNVAPAAPMTASEVMDFDVGREYGIYVRDSLANAMVDYANTLSLEAHERLVVVGRVAPQNALALDSNKRKLVLQLLASDLLAFVNGEITRDELKARVVESRF